MKSFICFLRSNKLARILLAVMILISFFGLAAHHHEAGETGHECPMCRLVQLISAVIFAWVVFFLYKKIPQTRFIFVREVSFLSPILVSSLRNRAPPSSR